MYVNSESTNIEVNDQITNAETSFQRAIEDAELLLTAKVVTKNDVMDEVDVEVLSDLNPEPDDDIEEEGEKGKDILVCTA